MWYIYFIQEGGKQKMKKGISLIVLVITIIVMIILAASVVITLSNTGIIDRANHAVQLTDEKQVQDLAAMLWAETYLDPSKKDDIENVVKQELAEQGITEDKWNIEISNTGITITAKGNETDDNQGNDSEGDSESSSGSDSGNNIVVNVTSSTLSEDYFELESYDPETITFTITTQLEKSVENEKVKLKYSFYIAFAHQEILTHRAGEQVRRLQHIADGRVQPELGALARVASVDQHLSLRRLVEPADQIDQRGFARARFADDGDRRSLGNGKVEVFKHVFVAVGVHEADVAEFDVAVKRFPVFTLR